MKFEVFVALSSLNVLLSLAILVYGWCLVDVGAADQPRRQHQRVRRLPGHQAQQCQAGSAHSHQSVVFRQGLRQSHADLRDHARESALRLLRRQRSEAGHHFPDCREERKGLRTRHASAMAAGYVSTTRQLVD